MFKVLPISLKHALLQIFNSVFTNLFPIGLGLRPNNQNDKEKGINPLIIITIDNS
jgi:hypothetical protein